MKLTIGQLTNLLQHSWELQRELGFHMQDPTAFRQHICNMPAVELNAVMENLGLFFRITREIGDCEIELKANGEHSLFAPLCQTKTANATGSDENLVAVPDTADTPPIFTAAGRLHAAYAGCNWLTSIGVTKGADSAVIVVYANDMKAAIRALGQHGMWEDQYPVEISKMDSPKPCAA